MFTVKHISVGGDEVLYVAEDVACRQCRAPQEPGQNEPWQSVVTIGHRDHPMRNLHNGTVFVMNESGATVSRWDLGASPVPLRDGVTGMNIGQKIRAAMEPDRSVTSQGMARL